MLLCRARELALTWLPCVDGATQSALQFHADAFMKPASPQARFYYKNLVNYLPGSGQNFMIETVWQGLHWVRVDGASTWQHQVGVHRVDFPSVVTSGMTVHIACATTPPRNTQNVFVTGKASVSDFVLPVAYKMLAGGSAGPSPSLAPSKATLFMNHTMSSLASPPSSLIVDTEVVSVLAGTLSIHLNDTAQQHPLHKSGIPEMTVSGVNGMGVSSHMVNSGLKAMLSSGSYLLNGPFNAQFPPLNTSIGEAADMADETAAMWATLQSPWWSQHSPMAVSGTVCPSAQYPPKYKQGTMVVTANGRTYSCVVPAFSATLLESAVTALTTAFQKCHVASFVRPGVFTKGKPLRKGELPCGTIGLYPVVPGLLVSFVVDTGTQPTVPFAPLPWKPSVAPTFGTWGDALCLQHALAGGLPNAPYTTPPPVATPTAKLDGVVPADLAAYYPTSLPVVSFPFRYFVKDTAPRSGIHAVARTVNDTAALVLGPSAVSSLNVYTTTTGAMGVAYGAPPAGDGMNITFSTAFNSTFNMSCCHHPERGPYGGRNSMVLTVTGEVRHADRGATVQPFSCSASIKFTAGSSVKDTASTLLAQLEGSNVNCDVGADLLKRMVSSYLYVGRGPFKELHQYKFNVSRVRLQADGGSLSPWVIPSGVHISSAYTPCFKNNSYVRAKERVIAKDVAVEAHADIKAKASQSSGRVGVIAAQADDVAAAGNVDIRVTPKGDLYHVMPAVATGLRSSSRFYTIFKADGELC